MGIDRAPIDLGNPDDARWLLACVWPGTGRFTRTRAAIRLARDNPPTVIRGNAIDALPEVLASLAADAVAVVLTTSAFSYFSVEERRRFVNDLEAESQHRPIAWLSSDTAGVVEVFKGGQTAGDVLGVVLFDRGERAHQLLAYTHQHGHWIEWGSGPGLGPYQ
jgi:hypothetical protein